MQMKRVNWVAFAGPVVTIAFSPTLTYEPFDNVKLLLLGVFAGIGLSGFIAWFKDNSSKYLRLAAAAVFLFYFALLVPIFLSHSPISQQIFGVAGRSLGFLHYFFLGLIFLGALAEPHESSATNFLKGLTLTGVFEALYGIIQYLKLDPISWENQYNWVFGTFGNPNFLSAFVGISVSASVFMISQKQKSAWKIMHRANIVLGTTLAALSDSIQGLVLIAVSVTILFVASTFRRSKFIGIAVSATGSLSFVAAILGILQIGPLTRFLYQDSTSFRGDYWRAGIAMAKENLFTGVGLDSYGDFYRQYRDVTAGQRRGLDIYSDSAHNLLIDLAATGGVFLLVSYLLINLLVIAAISRSLRATTQMELSSLALPIVWLTFQIQTLISINVSSLAIWGWLAAGPLIARGNQEVADNQGGKASKGRVSKTKSAPKTMAVSLVSLSLILVLPLLRSDIRIGSAVKSTNAIDLENAVTSWPRSCYFMAKAEEAYTEAGADDISLAISIKSVDSNPRCFNSWRHILENPNATAAQKELAVSKMHTLDPLVN
jgi:O-antigen ligase